MRFLTQILAKAGITVDGTATLNNLANASTDTDKFLVSDSGVIKYRTGAQLMSDLMDRMQSDYDFNIGGTKNSVNKTFVLSANFMSGTTKVYINGIRLTPGAEYDYVEAGTNQITFTNAPDPGDLIVVDYIKS
jgi:hypothetical protein